MPATRRIIAARTATASRTARRSRPVLRHVVVTKTVAQFVSPIHHQDVSELSGLSAGSTAYAVAKAVRLGLLVRQGGRGYVAVA